ncbi:RidA family protein [Sphingobium sp. Cam5-1]|uniref:RidA family protein n=1 Tax=Sphingobium sp. Cam5-1 TaxID=2789327 RepID=UPI0018AD249E|nr:RidA family protein [Sphingobium sp. Cam5-1]QPI74067.1 RidA family protein [Sphingobium sp. Cam5-1]
MAKRDIVTLDQAHALYEAHGYSAAVRSGRFLFVSGQVGAQADGSPVEDIAGQIDLAFRNLDAVLKAAGCTFDDIVDVTSFNTDPETQFGAVMEAKARYFNNRPYPNWTAVGVSWLAGFQFEIKVIARIPENADHD